MLFLWKMVFLKKLENEICVIFSKLFLPFFDQKSCRVENFL